MRKFWPLLIIIPLLFMLFATVPLMAEEELPPVDLKMVSYDMETAIRVNPVSVGDYMVIAVDFVGELFKRFGATAKPMVGFMDEIYPGVEITIYEQPKWVATWGVIYQEEDAALQDQPSFIGVELREFPLLAGLADIFTKFRPGVMYVDKGLYFQLSYEFVEE